MTRQERNRALVAEADARDGEGNEALTADDSFAVLCFFREYVLAAARPEGEQGGLGRDATIRDAVDAALPKVAEAFKNQPTVEASIRVELGATYLFLGRARTRIAQLERPPLFEEHLGPDHADTLALVTTSRKPMAPPAALTEAVRLHEATLRARELQLGPDIPTL